MKKITGILLGITVLALIVITLIKNKPETVEESVDNTEVVTTFTASSVPMVKQFSSNATVQAILDLNLSSEVSGRVVRVFADKGSRVRKGTPLLELDSELYKADYQAALAAYNALLKDEQRFSHSNEAGGISDQQLDNIRTQLQAARSRLDVSKWKLENTEFKSPVNGTVNLRFVEVGSLIGPNVPLFEIVDDSAMKLVCMVPRHRLSHIAVGQKVSAADGAHEFKGTVTNIGIKADRAMNFPVEILLDRDSELKLGMYLNVRFSSEEGRTGILIPRKAVVGSATAANVYLAVEGKAVRREVKLGEMYGDEIEIAEGLQDGDVVILSGLMNISDKSEIRIVE